MAGGGDAGLHQVEQEETGAAAELERLGVRPAGAAGNSGEPVAGVVDAPLVVGDRPLLVVGRGLPVVVEHVGQLHVGPGALYLGSGRVRVRVRRAHRLVKVALPGPCSTNDSMPARRSSVANRPENCSRSSSRPVSRSVSRPAAIAPLAARSASPGPPTNCLASSTAAA